MFSEQVNPQDLGLVALPANYTEPFQTYLYKILYKNMKVLTQLGRGASCLARIGEKILPLHYDILLDIIKHSQLGNTTPTAADRQEFFEKYVQRYYFIETLNKTEPIFLQDELKFLSFCEIGSSEVVSRISNMDSSQCILFEPTVTAKGLCHTFNGSPMSSVYKETPEVKLWNSVFKPTQNVKLIHPSGYGQSNGLNVVLNMHQPSPREGKKSSKNAVTTITTKSDWVDIYANNFVIEPGFSYTFKVLTSQMITTKRFDEMEQHNRNCNLSNEVNDLDYLRNYSKLGCNYDCLLKQVTKNCNCTPWYIPRNDDKKLPYCEEKRSLNSEETYACIKKHFSEFSTQKCNCPENCRDTTFTVFDFKQPIENPGLSCNVYEALEKKEEVYPNSVFCDICRKALKVYKILFHFKYITVNNSTNSADFSKLCNEFLLDNVATVKVEMATPGMTQSVRDKRFNFEGQLSDLGNQ